MADERKEPNRDQKKWNSKLKVYFIIEHTLHNDKAATRAEKLELFS